MGCEEAIAARVQVSGKAGILRMIEDGDGDGLVANQAAEIAPAPAGAPCGVAFFSFACEIGAVDAGVVQLSHRCGAAARIGVNLGLVGRNLESADDAKAQHAVFGVGERNFFIQSAESGEAAAGAQSGPPRKAKGGCLLSRIFFAKVTQSVSASSSPCWVPLFAETTEC